jgi:shikimate kinase
MPPSSRFQSIPHIVITGLMGSGKTTTGRMLAQRLGRTWRDSDVDIEAATGRTVRELRDREGVDAMHARESMQLRDALATPGPDVISAAASVIDDAATRAALADNGVGTIWLHARPALLAKRFASDDAHRPAYGDVAEAFLAEQATQREPLLASIGAHVIDVDGLTPDEVVARAMETLASIER